LTFSNATISIRLQAEGGFFQANHGPVYPVPIE